MIRESYFWGIYIGGYLVFATQVLLGFLGSKVVLSVPWLGQKRLDIARRSG